MTDRTIKAKNPWAKYFVINSGAPKLDDAAKARIEMLQQVKELKGRNKSVNRRVLK